MNKIINTFIVILVMMTFLFVITDFYLSYSKDKTPDDIFGDWTMNPFTNQLDYYETASSTSTTLDELDNVTITAAAYGDMIMWNGSAWIDRATSTLGLGGGGSGTVTSVDLIASSSFYTYGGPVTSSGVLGLGIASGYTVPLTASTSEWATAYGWGDHSLAGYITSPDDSVSSAEFDNLCSTNDRVVRRVGGTWSCFDDSVYYDDTDTQLSTEQVTDMVGAMVTGNTETNITVTFQDGDETIDFVVTDAWWDDVADITDDTLTEAKLDFSNSPTTNYVVSWNGSALTWIATSTWDTDTDTTCDGSSCNVTNTGTLDGYEAAALLDDTNLTQEEVEDYVGGMTSGTETNITVSYNDGTGNLDYVVTDAWWDADGDIAADEISESKINFATVCAAGNHLYVNGNDLACEADDDTTYTAGDYITLTATDFDVDDEAVSDTKCIWFEDPTADDDFESIWENDMGKDATILEISCESDQTVNLDLQVDDGSPADVNGSDLVCTSAEVNDTSFAGDSVISDNEELDLAITSVSGTPTWVQVCWHIKFSD